MCTYAEKFALFYVSLHFLSYFTQMIRIRNWMTVYMCMSLTQSLKFQFFFLLSALCIPLLAMSQHLKFNKQTPPELKSLVQYSRDGIYAVDNAM